MTGTSTIGDYMVREVVTLPSSMEINHAVALLLERGIAGAPVLDDTGEMVGILTKKDCFKAALNASYYQQWGGTVASYMSPNVETLDAGLDIVTAAERFLASPFRFYPVTRDGQLAGILSRSDLLRAFIELR